MPGKARGGGATDHDSLYHRLFSDPRLVAQLLRDSIPALVLAGFDLDSMERVNAKLHAETGERREPDMVWRIPRNDDSDVYVMLLLDFQSTSDYRMALRVLVYVGLLWQHLVKENRLLPGRRLPPVLPLVLYNGARRWTAPLSLGELVGLPEGSPLWPMQPQARYHIIDEGAIPDDELAKRDTLTSLLFQAERSEPPQAADIAAKLVLYFKGNSGFDDLQSGFLELLNNGLQTIDPDVVLPKSLEEMANMQSMLVERAKALTQQWKQEGKQEGKLEGIQEGMAALLMRQLERRFGPLPDWARERIQTGEPAALDEWALRVLDAERLEDVLR